MKCKHCGAEIANDSRFCEFCGKKMKKKMPVWAVLLIVLGGVINLIIVVMVFFAAIEGAERDYGDETPIYEEAYPYEVTPALYDEAVVCDEAPAAEVKEVAEEPNCASKAAKGRGK